MARREYINAMRNRYAAARGREERATLLDEIVKVTGYNRKYATRVLQPAHEPTPKKPRKKRAQKYQQCLSVIALAWEALDYCCAERLHPRLVVVAQQLAKCGAIWLEPEVLDQLRLISRATLARRLSKLDTPKPRLVKRNAPNPLLSEIPVSHYPWNEAKPGALEVDLLEHCGANAMGQFVCTLVVTDVVTGWTCRRAIMGKAQPHVHQALEYILKSWPHTPWGFHSDNGSEFLNHQVVRFVRSHGLKYNRSRPYRKNDSAHVEQRNRALRQLIGYGRFETQAQLDWLNRVYEVLDPYSNTVLPTMKLVHKRRIGCHVQRRYDTAKTPLARLIDSGVLSPLATLHLLTQAQSLNPLEMRRRLDHLISHPPREARQAADND